MTTINHYTNILNLIKENNHLSYVWIRLIKFDNYSLSNLIKSVPDHIHELIKDCTYTYEALLIIRCSVLGADSKPSLSILLADHLSTITGRGVKRSTNTLAVYVTTLANMGIPPEEVEATLTYLTDGDVTKLVSDYQKRELGLWYTGDLTMRQLLIGLEQYFLVTKVNRI